MFYLMITSTLKQNTLTLSEHFNIVLWRGSSRNIKCHSFDVKHYRKNFCLSSNFFPKFFLLSQKKNSRLIILTKYIKKTQMRIGFKIGLVSRGVVTTTTSIYSLPSMLPSPQTLKCYPSTLHQLFLMYCLVS